MKTGFTGTQNGMTPKQIVSVLGLLTGTTEGHHGVCIGADEQFHRMCIRSGCRTVGHPPVDTNKMSQNCICHEQRKPKPFLIRNHEIVDDVDRMIAAPAQGKEILRSGTWATIRYAKKVGRLLRVVFPDGTIEKYDKTAR